MTIDKQVPVVETWLHICAFLVIMQEQAAQTVSFTEIKKKVNP